MSPFSDPAAEHAVLALPSSRTWDRLQRRHTRALHRSGNGCADQAVQPAVVRLGGPQLPLVDPDAEYVVEGDGQVTLADEPGPWISEPQGITIRYAGGQPIGRLLGMVIGDAGDAPSTPRSVGDIFPIGRRLSFTPGEAGTLYLRINDFCSEVADNTGRYDVLIRRQTGGDSATSRAGVSCP